MTTVTVATPKLSRTELQHHIILLHCISCNRVTKHKTLTTHNTPLSYKYLRIGQKYKRRCLECGLEDERKF